MHTCQKGFLRHRCTFTSKIKISYVHSTHAIFPHTYIPPARLGRGQDHGSGTADVLIASHINTIATTTSPLLQFIPNIILLFLSLSFHVSHRPINSRGAKANRHSSYAQTQEAREREREIGDQTLVYNSAVFSRRIVCVTQSFSRDG